MATELVLTLFQGGDSQVCNHPEKHSHFGAVYNVSGLTDNYQIDVYIYMYIYICIYICIYVYIYICTWQTESMQNFSHFGKNHVFPNNDFFWLYPPKDYLF